MTPEEEISKLKNDNFKLHARCNEQNSKINVLESENHELKSKINFFEIRKIVLISRIQAAYDLISMIDGIEIRSMED